MGADLFLLYYGVRYEIESQSEITMLEYSLKRHRNNELPINGLDADRWHPKVRAAVRVGLQWTWGMTRSEGYYLLIGKELGRLGWEYAADVAIPTQELEGVIAESRRLLTEARLNEPAALHAHHEPS